MAGVYIDGKSGVSSGNVVEGNLIGQASGGIPGPGNNGYGVLLLDSPSNTVLQIGSAANRFGHNSFGNYRSLTGPAARTSVTAARKRLDGAAAHTRLKQPAARPAGPARRQSRRADRGS